MGEETKDLIIEKVASIPAIWDKSHEHHHNRYVLEKHWKMISSAARLPEEETKRIWRNLRQEFGKQVKRIVKNGRQSPDSANPNWPYYRSLLFLKDQFIPKNTSGEYMEQDESDTFSDFYNYEEEEINNSSHFKEEKRNADHFNATHSNSPQSGNWNNQGSYMEPKRARTSQMVVENSLINLEREKLEMQRQYLNAVDGGDEDVGFFNSLLPYVRQLTPQQKMMYRMQIQQQLYDTLYGSNEPMSILSTNHSN